jgi:hypothetical protein
MIHLFIVAPAARHARMLWSPLRRERRGRITTEMGAGGAPGFREVLSGVGRGTTLVDAEVGFYRADRAAAERDSWHYPLCSSVLPWPKGVSTNRRTRPETAIEVRRFLGSGVPFSSI